MNLTILKKKTPAPPLSSQEKKRCYKIALQPFSFVINHQIKYEILQFLSVQSVDHQITKSTKSMVVKMKQPKRAPYSRVVTELFRVEIIHT